MSMQVTERRPVALRRDKVLVRWAFVVGYAVCIFTISAIPGNALPHVSMSDKLIHAGVFGLLGLLTCRALKVCLPTWPQASIALLSVFVTVFYGVTDELHQLFVPQRMVELADVAANSVGAVLAAAGWAVAGKRWPWLL